MSSTQKRAILLKCIHERLLSLNVSGKFWSCLKVYNEGFTTGYSSYVCERGNIGSGPVIRTAAIAETVQ